MCTKRQISIICALRILIVSYLWPADDKRGSTEDDGWEIHHLLSSYSYRKFIEKWGELIYNGKE